MKITWHCPHCLKKEETSPRVERVTHIHGKEVVELVPYKKPRKPRGEVTPKSLKKEVWALFSELVRRSEADPFDYCKCVTCGKIDHYTRMQAGHFIHGTSFLIPELVHPQCPVCNGFKAGMAIEYKEYMLSKYGQNKLDELTFKAKRIPTRLSVFDLECYKKVYQEKLNNLKKE